MARGAVIENQSGSRYSATMATFIDVIGFFACLFGMFATFKAVFRFCRTDGRGTWWGGPAFATSLVAVPFAWLVVMGVIMHTTKAIWPVEF